MAGNLFHEINNLLAIIVGRVSLLCELADFAEIRVTDCVSGMPARNIEKTFSAYFTTKPA